MIKNLYLNEELVVSLSKENKLIGKIRKEFLAKSIDSPQLQFIRNYPDVMNKLKEGQDLQVTTNGTIITSSIDEKMGRGFSIPSSIEDLDDRISGRRM